MKQCELCGAELKRKAYERPREFEARRYCGNSCAKQARRKESPTTWQEPNCDCGKPATSTLRFLQFNALGHPYWNTLRVCEECKTDALLFDKGVSVAA